MIDVDCYYNTERSLVARGEKMGVCMGSIDECGSRDKNRANAPELLGTADVFIYRFVTRVSERCLK
jgi:hypothetical protein